MVREEVRANLLAGVTPSEAAIVDASAARGVGAVRSRVREGVRANLLAGVAPSGRHRRCGGGARVEVVRSHRRDIDALRGAAAVLLSELSAPLYEDAIGELRSA